MKTAVALFYGCVLASFLAAPPALAAVRPISGQAFFAADEAYKAYDRGDYGVAIRMARRAIALRPDIPRLRLLLVRALVHLGAPRTAIQEGMRAERAGASSPELRAELAQLKQNNDRSAAPNKATDAPPPSRADSTPGYDQASRAYEALASHDYESGVLDAEGAVAMAPDSLAYRILLVDLLTAEGRRAEAERAAVQAEDAVGKDSGLEERRAYLLAALGRNGEAAPIFADVLNTAAAGRRRGLALALADASLGAGDPAAAAAALDPYADDKSFDVASRRALALTQLRRRSEALSAVRTAEQLAPDEPARLRFTFDKVILLADLGDVSEARETLRRASRAPDFGRGIEADVAELALRLHDDQTAHVFFDRARKAGRLKGKPILDAAYAAKRTVHNREAVQLFDEALAEADALDLSPGFRFRLGREATEVARTWGVNASILSGSLNFPTAALAGTSGSNTGRVTQTGAEVYWRPPVIGYRDGRTVELFGRVFTTLQDDTGGPTGGDSFQGYLGGRWKPIASQNLVLEVSRLVKLGDASRNDWLLRAAYSYDHGLDLVADTRSTTAWQIYTEVDRLTDLGETLAVAQGRIGRAFRPRSISDRLVVTPLIDASYSFDDLSRKQSSAGVGPGVGLRYWFHGARDRGPASYVDLNFGYRFHVAGDNRVDGAFVGLSVAY